MCWLYAVPPILLFKELKSLPQIYSEGRRKWSARICCYILVECNTLDSIFSWERWLGNYHCFFPSQSIWVDVSLMRWADPYVEICFAIVCENYLVCEGYSSWGFSIDKVEGLSLATIVNKCQLCSTSEWRTKILPFGGFDAEPTVFRNEFELLICSNSWLNNLAFWCKIISCNHIFNGCPATWHLFKLQLFPC